MAAIKFQKHYVEGNGVKAKVSYHAGTVFVMGPTGPQRNESGEYITRECVTIYAKGYGNQLGAVGLSNVGNDSDSQTDYFETDRARIFPGDALYAAAKARADQNAADCAARWAKRSAKYEARAA
jgi:hypothetical protein